MPSWPSSSASPRDSCDSEPLQSGSVSPEPGGRNDGGIDVDEAARRVLAEHVAAARPSRATREPFSPDASRRSPPEAPDRTGASEESGRPGSNRRRPAWEAFRALAGQGFFDGGSRNGITQYGLAAPDIRDFPPFRERPFETSAAPRPSSCWSPRNGGARRASRPRRDPPNLTRGAGSGVVGPPRHNRYAATHHPEANVRVPVGNVAEKNNAPASKSDLDQLTSLHGPSTP